MYRMLFTALIFARELTYITPKGTPNTPSIMGGIANNHFISLAIISGRAAIMCMKNLTKALTVPINCRQHP